MDANGATIDEGKYIVIWRRGADGWELHRLAGAVDGVMMGQE
jgi:hypothetical protein